MLYIQNYLSYIYIIIYVFHIKQIDKKLSFPQTFFPIPKLTYFAYKSTEINYYLKDFNLHGASDSHNTLLMFMNRTADTLAPKLIKIFRFLIPFGCLPTP